MPLVFTQEDCLVEGILRKARNMFPRRDKQNGLKHGTEAEEIFLV